MCKFLSHLGFLIPNLNLNMKFKCADAPKHVEKTNITGQDVMFVVEFLRHFNMNITVPEDLINKAVSEHIDMSARHDVIHMLLDDVLVAHSEGHEALSDASMTYLMGELRIKQQHCREGEDKFL